MVLPLLHWLQEEAELITRVPAWLVHRFLTTVLYAAVKTINCPSHSFLLFSV